MAQKLYIVDHVHQVMVRGCEKLGVTPVAAAAITKSKPQNVGRNQMHVYMLTVGSAQAVFEHLANCMISLEVNGDILAACEKTLEKLHNLQWDSVTQEEAEVKAKSETAIALSMLAGDGQTEEDRLAVETAGKKKKKNSPNKKPGGHIPAIWRDWSDEKLERHLLQNVYISDKAWAREGEVRGKGEKRADFIQRAFAERLAK